VTRRLDVAAFVLAVLVAAAAALLLTLGPAGEETASAAAAAFPTRLQVVSKEFGLTLSRASVPGGKVRVELANFGEDPHDLRLHRIGGTKTYSIPETAPGERTTRTFTVVPGRLRVWCAVADHRALGMRATLRVVRRT
jgi:plastocyanin